MSLLVDLEVPARGVAAAFEVSSPTAIVGPNGAGKTTLIHAIAGLLDYRGTVALDGRALDGLPSERRRVGVVFQDYLLFPHLTVLENVAFGPRAQRRRRVHNSGGSGGRGATRRDPRPQRPDHLSCEPREVAAAQLDRLGIGHLAARHPAELSGGQAQRVALARALAADPEVLLLDEPLAALDVEVRDDVRAELASHLAGFAGVTIVVTHDQADVAALARDVLVLERGRVTQHGSLPDLTADPATPYVRRLTRQ